MPELDLEFFRAKLLQLKEQLHGLTEQLEESSQVVELDQTRVGRLSRMDAMQAQAMAQASRSRQAATLRQVDAALVRIEACEYGSCTDCDETIDPRRLTFDPTAIRCIQCAEIAEE